MGDITSFKVTSFDPRPMNLTYDGDAFVPPGSTFLRLTKTDASGKVPQQHSVGRVVYSPSVLFWEPGRQASFDTTIEFFITPVDKNPADGIAFFVAPVNHPIQFPGGSFGIFDESGNAPSVFAVEFDTFFEGDNRKWDPDYRHIGININSRISKKNANFDNPFKQAVTARITYDSPSRTVSVVVTYGEQTSSVSHVVDLKGVLTQWVQVGIAGATGALVALHDLLSWSFTSTLVRDEKC